MMPLRFDVDDEFIYLATAYEINIVSVLILCARLRIGKRRRGYSWSASVEILFGFLGFLPFLWFSPVELDPGD